MTKGILYFAQNPAFQHLTKIGKTTKSDIKSRGLSGSNVPEDFKYLALLDCEDVDWAEKKVHEQFGKFRHETETGRSTEFYWSGCIESAVKYAKDLKGVSDQTKETVKKIQKKEKEVEREAGVLDTDSKEERDEKIRVINAMDRLNIPIGAELVFVKDATKKCKVVKPLSNNGSKRIEYKGEIYSLSQLAQQFLKEAGYNWPSARGIMWFSYNGELLLDKLNRLESECGGCDYKA